MAGGYGRKPSDPIEALAVEVKSLRSAIADLGRPTGTSIASLVDQVQAALANIDATVTAAIAANSYTKSQIDSKVASPGNISPGNVNASGQVVSASPIKSPGSHGYNVTTSYVAGWIDGDGTFGTSPSSGAVKVDLAVIADADARKILGVVPYWGRYEWDAPDTPLKAFVLAEDVQSSGFGPDVAPIVDGDEPRNIGTDDDPVMIQPGHAWTVNYSQLVVPLLALAREQDGRIATLETQVAALVAGGNPVDGGS
jgi:hypothetical protein